MRHLKIQSVGTALAVESVHAVAVYDKKDGRVCHLHHVITFAGIERRPQQEHERNARSYAEKMGHDPARLEVLYVPDFRPFARKYRVDLKRKVLVEDETVSKIKKKQIRKKRSRENRAKPCPADPINV
jgi:hypothetical protein